MVCKDVIECEKVVRSVLSFRFNNELKYDL